ncbi:MAG TPA: CRTAC1 family protein [Gemmataceae bacterium]|nr:CRTAC1 family protein [Gemmataceae bacterium]
MEVLPRRTSRRRVWLLAAGLGAGLGLLVVAAGVLPGCFRAGNSSGTGDPAIGPPWFADITEESGLHFDHDAGPVESYFVPQIMGSGVALFDFDGDGRLGVYLIHNGGPKGKKNQLFRQTRDGKFVDISKGSGLDVAGFGMGVAIADVNNDGRPDVLLTEYRGIRLFLNNGNGRFTDITKEAGLNHPLWAVCACFFDFNRDGWLDLAVTNYASYDPAKQCEGVRLERDYCPPRQFEGQVTKLYQNLGGPAVRFKDVTLAAGLSRLTGRGMGVVAADFNDDGWPDLLVANDLQPNRLWINRRDGTFAEEGTRRGIAYNRMGVAEANMGIGIGDINGSRMPSVYITHLTEETNTLWVQGPRGEFQDKTAEANLTRTRWRATGFGVVMADFDNDGAQDMAVANGRVNRGKPADEQTLGPYWCHYAERNQVFAGDGAGKFRDVSSDNPAVCGWSGISRSIAFGDLDRDGGLDLIVTTIANRARVYRNIVRDRGHWLSIRATDPRLRRDAYGAEITVSAGGRSWVNWINPNQGYLSSNAPVAHFGLGNIERIDSIQVRWPDGDTAAELFSFSDQRVDQAIVLERGKSQRSK